MHIIEVIPITRTAGIDTLTYFTKKDIPVGAIVDVPLRKKVVHAIVVSTKKAEDIKSDIKKAGFIMKKLDKVKSVEFFEKSFINTAQILSQYYATSLGSVIDALVPEYILKNIDKLETQKNTTGTPNDLTAQIKMQEKYVVQGNNEERYGTWKSLIRQEFARKKSLLFILPTIEDSEYAFQMLDRGIEGYAFTIHGNMTPAKIIETWNNIIKMEHPVTIITTGSFISLPRQDIETVIIEKESSKNYKIIRRPFVDIRKVVEIFTEKKGMKLFLADDMLRIETLSRENSGELVQASPFKFRSLSTAKDDLIDMKSYKTRGDGFKILSDEVIEMIQGTKNESEHMVILATRRGVAPTTICGDCQNIVTCNNCSAPVVLHKVGSTNSKNGEEKSFFLCHRCGERRSTEEYCKICGSWKLGVVGIGIDLVIEKIKDKFPDISVFKIDSDSVVKTRSKKGEDRSARGIVQKFKSQPGSILIGTEMMLSYLHDKVENSAIISLDSLFALPDFRIQEKILHMMIYMRSFTTKHFIVQTRKPDEKVFEYGLKGNMSDFYRDEIESRKKFNYPPYTTLIKITLEGKKDKIVKEMEEVQNLLDPYEVEVFPAFTHTVNGNYVLHGLIRLITNKWPNTDLIEKIRSIPRSAVVKVDPETLL